MYVIYNKFSHGAAFYTLNGKNVNVMLELALKGLMDNKVLILPNLIISEILYVLDKISIRYAKLHSCIQAPAYVKLFSN